MAVVAVSISYLLFVYLFAYLVCLSDVREVSD